VDDFFKAVDQGDREKVHQLLAQGGVEINRKYTRYERTALHQAVLRGHFEVAKLLVERGADLFAYNNHGRTPREIALASHERLRNYLAEQEIKKMKN
jgi:ankyrin repeat protein